MLLPAASLAFATSTSDLPFGRWTRARNEPILSPQGSTWESAGTFNPAVVFHNGKFVMLYRAQDASGTSRLGYAESTDGLHFTRRPDPVLSPEAPYEKDGGVEDPRLQKFGDIYYLTYTGYNKKDAQLCLATSRDLTHWERKGVILPAYKGNWNKAWTKSGAIVPEKIDGKYWMYWLGTAEPGPPPILTERGIVFIYNGADDQLVYRTAVAIFDRRDPRKLLFRSDQPIFTPEKQWEKVGQVPNVVFVEGMVLVKGKDEGMVRHGGRYLFYYGAADKYIGVAEALAK